MKSKYVWQKVKKDDIPQDKRLIGNKWVFKKKKDGRYRALCALGYSQVQGEDFMDISSPVVDDVTVRAVITSLFKDGTAKCWTRPRHIYMEKWMKKYT
jgi:hypothetical protein